MDTAPVPEISLSLSVLYERQVFLLIFAKYRMRSAVLEDLPEQLSHCHSVSQ